MGPIQSSLNQSLGTLATFAGISKVGEKIGNIEQNIAPPEQRAKAEAEARALQQRADWSEELKGVNRQLKNIDKLSTGITQDWYNIENKYVKDEKGNIKKDVEGNVMLSKEAEDFLNKINMMEEDRVNLITKQKDLQLKLNKKTDYKKSLDESGKAVANQVYLQKFTEAVRNADTALTKDLVQQLSVNDLHSKLKKEGFYSKLKGGTK